MPCAMFGTFFARFNTMLQMHIVNKFIYVTLAVILLVGAITGVGTISFDINEFKFFFHDTPNGFWRLIQVVLAIYFIRCCARSN